MLSAATSAADGAATAAAGHLRANGDQRGHSTRCQHGRHGGPPRQEEDHPDSAEVHHHHYLVQINGEEIQQHLFVICPAERSQVFQV